MFFLLFCEKLGKGTNEIPLWVFANREGGFLDMYNVKRRYFKRVLRKAGLRSFRFHDIRHTFASQLVMKGAPMRAFLQELDDADIGRGELRLGDPNAGTSPQSAFEAAIVNAAPPPAAAAGFETFRSGVCSACHFPFQVSIVGAPDLSTAVDRLDGAALHEVLTSGRPDKGMPPPVPPLSEAQREQIIAYFRWLNSDREGLRSQTERRQSGATVDWSRLPWWEYR